jgi:hypothetical protein
MTKEDPPSPAHLEWVIDGRARNQKAALDLYEMMTDCRRQIARQQLSTEAQDLAAIAFSLWRAVFLADRSGATDAKMADAEYFLGKMLTDNAIAFTQDRSAREWTFNYYLDNAWYRLKDLRQKNLTPPRGKRSARNRWDYLENAFEKAVSNFQRKLGR